MARTKGSKDLKPRVKRGTRTTDSEPKIAKPRGRPRKLTTISPKDLVARLVADKVKPPYTPSQIPVPEKKQKDNEGIVKLDFIDTDVHGDVEFVRSLGHGGRSFSDFDGFSDGSFSISPDSMY